MSDVLTQAEQRAALADAIGGVTAEVGDDTVITSGYTTQPKTPQAYDAWPVWVATRPAAMCVQSVDWQVLVALPGSDPQMWCATGDALMNAISDALAAHDVTRVEPVQILLADGQSMPGLAFALTI